MTRPMTSFVRTRFRVALRRSAELDVILGCNSVIKPLSLKTHNAFVRYFGGLVLGCIEAHFLQTNTSVTTFF